MFSLAYLRVTEDVRRGIHEGVFADPVWLNQVDAVFARMYFDTIDDWHAGRTATVPQAWRIALQAEDDRAMSGIGNFMLAMNAHINRDFPNVIAEVGLTGPDGASHKPDHNAYNPRLDALYAPVFAEMAARFDPTFDDLDLGPLRRGLRRRCDARLARGGLAPCREPGPRPEPARAGPRPAGDRGVRRVPGGPDPRHVRLAELVGA